MYNNKIYILNVRIDPESAFPKLLVVFCMMYIFTMNGSLVLLEIYNAKIYITHTHAHTTHPHTHTHTQSIIHPSNFNTLLNIISHTRVEYVYRRMS